jgi:uncharacterized protein
VDSRPSVDLPGTPADLPDSASSRPIPFTTYVVKVASRCNLNCSYCYMYNLADQTYRGQPAVMRPDVVEALVARINSHASRHGLTWAHIILHGGEPLMMGKDRLEAWVKQTRLGLKEHITPYFSMQSNGALLDREWVDLLADLDVGIGISVDGPREFHDQYRVDHKGIGSFDDVVAGIRLLQEHPRGKQIFTSVMAVANTDIPPAELFAFWQYLDVDGFDLSLPHANHTHPPRVGRMTYGAWMIELFDLWFDQNRADRHIRYFENMLRLLFGYPLSTDNIGGRPVGVVVVETDGGIEPTDAFKCCEDGITKLGLNVRTNEFDDMYRFSMVDVLQRGAPRLCETCQACPVRDVCGGGYMPHRYRRENGFDNPSVYSADLLALISHMRERVLGVLPSHLVSKLC